MDESKILIKLIAEIAEYYWTFKQIADEVYKLTGRHITQPTVAKYLKMVWGDEYSNKKKDVREKYVKRKRLARAVMTEVKRKEEWDKMVEVTRERSLA